MPNPVRLDGVAPLASGVTRIVYPHPVDPGLLIKVLSPEFLARRGNSRKRYSPLKPARMNSAFAKQVQEQLILLGKGERIDEFMPRIVGFCDTDKGSAWRWKPFLQLQERSPPHSAS